MPNPVLVLVPVLVPVCVRLLVLVLVWALVWMRVCWCVRLHWKVAAAAFAVGVVVVRVCAAGVPVLVSAVDCVAVSAALVAALLAQAAVGLAVVAVYA